MAGWPDYAFIQKTYPGSRFKHTNFYSKMERMNSYIFPIFLLVFFWLLLFLLLWKIPLARNVTREKRSTTELSPTREMSVSIIIPARNEEKNLGSLLDSLNCQTLAPSEIIVVNDGSEDRTASISLEKGASLINLPNLPPGWTGKAHACFQGAKAASGDLLIFLDADTVIERDGLETVLNLFEKKGWLRFDPAVSPDETTLRKAFSLF